MVRAAGLRVFEQPGIPPLLAVAEPLVVLYCAIMDQAPASMSAILQQAAAEDHTASPSREVDDDAAGRVACFYSISNTQPGLAGVDLVRPPTREGMMHTDNPCTSPCQPCPPQPCTTLPANPLSADSRPACNMGP